MLQSETGYFDARPLTPDRRNLLQRTVGPYIGSERTSSATIQQPQFLTDIVSSSSRGTAGPAWPESDSLKGDDPTFSPSLHLRNLSFQTKDAIAEIFERRYAYQFRGPQGVVPSAAQPHGNLLPSLIHCILLESRKHLSSCARLRSFRSAH